MNAAKRSRLVPNLMRRLHGLLAVIGFVCGASALAQGSTVDCSVTAGACVAECSASGAIGSIFGGGSSADRNAKSAQCRANCERDRLTCQAQVAPSSPSATPGAPTSANTGTPAGSASGAPAKPPAGSPTQQPGDSTTLGSGPTSASGESVVLLSLMSKPLSNVSQPVMYVRQALSEAEARQHMRPTWTGPAPVHQAEAGHALVIYGNPLMTRRKLVESTLTGYEQSGGKRSNVRVQVLSEGVAAASPVVSAPQSAQSQPRITRPPDSQVSAATTTTSAASSQTSSQSDCVKFRNPAPDPRYPKPEEYFFMRNDCQVSVGLVATNSRTLGEVCRGHSVPIELVPGRETHDAYRRALICRYSSALPAGNVVNDMGNSMTGDCKCPAGTTPIQAPAAPAK